MDQYFYGANNSIQVGIFCGLYTPCNPVQYVAVCCSPTRARPASQRGLGVLVSLLPVQVAGVQYILDTVVQSLEANPDRKFVYADMVRPVSCR